MFPPTQRRPSGAAASPRVGGRGSDGLRPGPPPHGGTLSVPQIGGGPDLRPKRPPTTLWSASPDHLNGDRNQGVAGYSPTTAESRSSASCRSQARASFRPIHASSVAPGDAPGCNRTSVIRLHGWPGLALRAISGSIPAAMPRPAAAVLVKRVASSQGGLDRSETLESPLSHNRPRRTSLSNGRSIPDVSYDTRQHPIVQQEMPRTAVRQP